MQFLFLTTRSTDNCGAEKGVCCPIKDTGEQINGTYTFKIKITICLMSDIKHKEQVRGAL